MGAQFKFRSGVDTCEVQGVNFGGALSLSRIDNAVGVALLHSKGGMIWAGKGTQTYASPQWHVVRILSKLPDDGHGLLHGEWYECEIIESFEGKRGGDGKHRAERLYMKMRHEHTRKLRYERVAPFLALAKGAVVTFADGSQMGGGDFILTALRHKLTLDELSEILFEGTPAERAAATADLVIGNL